MITRCVAAVLLVCAATGEAAAQSATCSFDPGAAIVFVNVSGDGNPSTIEASGERA